MAFVLRVKVRRRWIPALFAVAYITCVFNAAYAQSSQFNLAKPGTIYFGIRYGGAEKAIKPFCTAFEDALRSKIRGSGISIIRHTIGNDQTGKDLPRYYGIINKSIDIECGPNSKLSGKLIYENKKLNIKDEYKNLVDFSNVSFYQTNTKLLLKKYLADKLSKSEIQLNNLKIGFISKTTTEFKFQNLQTETGSYDKAKAIPVDPTGNSRVEGEYLLTSTSTDAPAIDALASDGLILKSILENLPNKEEYTLYPSELNQGLLNFPPEEYVIVFRKNSNLSSTIDEILNEIVPKQKEELRKYEESANQLPSSLTPSPSPTTSSFANSNGGNTDENFKFIILGFLLLIGLLILLIRQFLSRKNILVREAPYHNQPTQAVPPRPYSTTPSSDSLLRQNKNEQIIRLHKALIDGFPTELKLEMMLDFRLNKNLTEIAGGNNLEAIVFNLIKAARVQGWLNDLVYAAYQDNPGNEKLMEIYEEFFPDHNHN